MHRNLEKALERQVNLNILTHKAIELKDNSKKLKKTVIFIYF